MRGAPRIARRPSQHACVRSAIRNQLPRRSPSSLHPLRASPRFRSSPLARARARAPRPRGGQGDERPGHPRLRAPRRGVRDAIVFAARSGRIAGLRDSGLARSTSRGQRPRGSSSRKPSRRKPWRTTARPRPRPRPRTPQSRARWISGPVSLRMVLGGRSPRGGALRLRSECRTTSLAELPSRPAPCAGAPAPVPQRRQSSERRGRGEEGGGGGTGGGERKRGGGGRGRRGRGEEGRAEEGHWSIWVVSPSRPPPPCRPPICGP